MKRIYLVTDQDGTETMVKASNKHQALHAVVSGRFVVRPATAIQALDRAERGVRLIDSYPWPKVEDDENLDDAGCPGDEP